MAAQHSILAISWIAYCVIHSLLASTGCKLFFKKISGKFFRYYRLIYTILAGITLALLFCYQLSFQSPQLLHSEFMKYLALITLILPGLFLMSVSIYKYFRLLSGIQSLFVAKPLAQLRIDGIHKYMRHPLYLGTLLFTWGMFFIFPLVSNFIVAFVLSLYVIIGIRFEEKKLVLEFGESYKAYQRNVAMLVPFLWKSNNKKR